MPFEDRDPHIRAFQRLKRGDTASVREWRLILGHPCIPVMFMQKLILVLISILVLMLEGIQILVRIPTSTFNVNILITT